MFLKFKPVSPQTASKSSESEWVARAVHPHILSETAFSQIFKYHHFLISSTSNNKDILTTEKKEVGYVEVKCDHQNKGKTWELQCQEFKALCQLLPVALGQLNVCRWYYLFKCINKYCHDCYSYSLNLI